MGEQQYQQNMNYQQNGNYQQAGYGQAAYQQQNNGGQQYSQGGVCPACGTQLINGVCPRCTNAQMMAAQNRNDARFTRLFMSPDEKVVATLGNNYLENYLYNGSIKKGSAVVSDKRAYFYGTSYTISYNNKGNPNATRMARSQVVDLKNSEHRICYCCIDLSIAAAIYPYIYGFRYGEQKLWLQLLWLQLWIGRENSYCFVSNLGHYFYIFNVQLLCE